MEVVIDVETAPIKYSSLSEYAIKTYQLNQNLYLSDQKEEVKEQLKGAHLIVFNAPFDQAQLHHAGFNIWNNKWSDVALMARIYDNRLAERQISSLKDIEMELLGTKSKQDYIDKLTSKYGNNFFAHPDIDKDPLFHEYGLNDTKITRELYDYLKPKIDFDLNTLFNNLQTKLAKWAVEGIPLPRERIEKLLKEMRTRLETNQEAIIDIRPNSKNTASLRGWSSSKLKTAYIRRYKPEWVNYLEVTKTDTLKFQSEDKERLLKVFPNDEVLQLSYKISYQKQIINNLEELLRYADGDIFRPYYHINRDSINYSIRILLSIYPSTRRETDY